MSEPVLAWDALLDLGPGNEGPLHVRLARALRRAIDGQVLPGGAALPSSRQLASDLGCSRWVVTEAYQQLAAEGYLDPTPGSATRVRLEGSSGARTEPAPRRPVPLDLVPGLPDLRAFPRTRWQAALRHTLADLPHPELGYPDPAGHPRLRDALAAQLRRTRSAQVTAGSLVVTGGVIDGAIRVLRTLAGDRLLKVGVEDPGWTRARDAVAAAGARPVPVPVDDRGLQVDTLTAAGVDAVIVGAAHQFPTGVVLADERRDELVDWARRGGQVILEDDYDAEFRYGRPPAPALQAAAPEHVVLLGSVSKTLAPALGIGWLAAPPRLRPLLIEQLHPRPAVPDQLALAHLLTDGGYDRHLREARKRYRRRRASLLTELDRHLPDARVTGAAAGLHLLLHLPVGVVASEVVTAAAARGLRVAALDTYQDSLDPTGTLVLGYANLGDGVVDRAVHVLAEVVREQRR